MSSEHYDCPQPYVKCHNSYCIAPSKVCDGTSDCLTGEDEILCGEYTAKHNTTDIKCNVFKCHSCV